jgi:hypothetical protein
MSERSRNWTQPLVIAACTITLGLFVTPPVLAVHPVVHVHPTHALSLPHPEHMHPIHTHAPHPSLNLQSVGHPHAAPAHPAHLVISTTNPLHPVHTHAPHPPHPAFVTSERNQ